MRNIDIKYFLYARKSSESEDRQMASIEDQINEVQKVARRLNLKIIDIISESKSAKEPGSRLEFNIMLQRIKRGEAQGILTWKLNRLARNPIDGGQISWLLQQDIIKHIQTFERDYHPSDNVLLMQVEFGMANQYVKDLSVDIRRGMRQKAERGWFPATNIPMGYIHNHGFRLGIDDEIIPDPKKFDAVKKLWKLILTGKYSIVEIKRKGDILGLKHKSGNLYSINAYYEIFNHEFYCGYYYWPDKGGNLVRYHGKHKSMISLHEFQKAQTILGKRAVYSCKGRKYDFPYRGIIKCGECGCTISPDHKLQVICKKCKYKFSIKTRSSCPKCSTDLSEMKKPTTIDILYYRCGKSKGKCSQGSITKEQIELAIENKLKEVSISKDFHSLALNSLKGSSSDIKESKNNLKRLKSAKTELEKKLNSLLNLRIDGEIDSEEFKISKNQIQKDISLFDSEILETKHSFKKGYIKRKKDLDFAYKALKNFKKSDDKQKTELLKDLSSNLVLMDKKLEITIRNSLLSLKTGCDAS